MNQNIANINITSLTQQVVVHLRARIISGFLWLLPLGISLLILEFIFKFTAGQLTPLLQELFGSRTPAFVLFVLSLLLFLLGVYLIGLFTTVVFGRRIVAGVEALLLKVPVLKTIYTASKNMVDTITMSNQMAFKQVVLVEFPRRDVWSLGFITGEITDDRGKPLVKVFVPNAPTITAGFLILLERSQVRETGMAVEQGIKMLVSGGIIGPSSLAPGGSGP